MGKRMPVRLHIIERDGTVVYVVTEYRSDGRKPYTRLVAVTKKGAIFCRHCAGDCEHEQAVAKKLRAVTPGAPDRGTNA